MGSTAGWWSGAAWKMGDVNYLEPGLVPAYEEDTEVLEFSPRCEYQQTIDLVNRNIGGRG
jgi:hypothetical protein